MGCFPCADAHALAIYYIIARRKPPPPGPLRRSNTATLTWTPTYVGRMEKTKQFGFGRSETENHARQLCPVFRLYDAYILKAQKVRTLIRREFDAAF